MTHSAVLRVKKLKGSGIVGVAAAHNVRAEQIERGARAHIDLSRTAQNESLITRPGYEPSPQAIARYAKERMQAAGIDKMRKDAVRAVEWVFSLPPSHAINERNFFIDSVAWVAGHFGGFENLLCADIHRDEAAPHCHVIALPLINGKMQGSDAVGGRSKLASLKSDFHAKVASRYGLKRASERLQGSQKAVAAKMVIGRLSATADAALRSRAWQPFKDAIERDPSPFMAALGLELPATKPKRTMTQIFTSKGKGAKLEHDANPIGFQRQAPALESIKPYAL